jgi:FHA domain
VFQTLGRKALDAEIVIDTIGYAPFEPGRLRNLQELSRQSQGTDRSCRSPSDVAPQFAAVADEIKKQYVVTFYSPAHGGDGKEHTLQVVVDAAGRPAYSNVVTTKLPAAVGVEASHWLRWLLISLGGIGLAALLGWWLVRERPEAAPAPEPPPAIVALSGKHHNQTFKFKPSRTVIGTAADCDIVIDDPFMSSRHCEVRVESNGCYKLCDLGSTNGIVVNEKKVREHELIDNDQFRLGRTDFKFKSIG